MRHVMCPIAAPGGSAPACTELVEESSLRERRLLVEDMEYPHGEAYRWRSRWRYLGGMELVTGSDDTGERQTIKLWDPASGKLLAGWKAQTATVAALASSPDGRLLASGSLDAGAPGNPNLVLWDVTSHERLAKLPGHADEVRSVAFSPDGRWLASANEDGEIRLWNPAAEITSGPSAARRARFAAWRSRPTGKPLPPRGRARSSISGTSPPARRSF